MKKYLVYVDDGANCLKLAIPAKSEKEAKKWVEGTGEIIKVKDVTEDFPISVDCVHNALLRCGFGQIEIDLITRCLTFNCIAE